MSELSSVDVGGLTDVTALVENARSAVRLRQAARQGKDAAVQAAKDFESILLHKLLKEMKDTIPDGGMLGDATSDQVKDIFWLYLAEELADQGGLGLWKQIYQQAGLGEAKGPATSVEQSL